MRPRNEVGMLKEIQQICTVQRMGVVFEVERANARVRELNRKRDAETEVLRASHAGWQQAVSGPSFQLAASAFWAAEVLGNQKAIDGTRADIRDAEADLSRLGEIRTAMTARCDAVADLTRSARRMEQHRRDEAALDEQMGRTAAGWRSA